MRFIYSVLFYAALPFIILRLLWKSRKLPAYRARILERFGYYKSASVKKTIWIHAVSLGEFIAAIPLIRKLQQIYSNMEIVVTTMTPTGSERAQKTFADTIHHVYAPYDYPFSIKRFLRHFNPAILLIMETEIWPNMLHCTAKSAVPILLLNARLSDKSIKMYKLSKPFFKPILNNLSLIIAQSKLDAQRFASLGVANSNILAAGNIKFDMDIPENIFIAANELRNKWGTNRPVWIAASTHNGEDEQILQAHRIVKQTLPNALLILVPRHPERFDAVAELCTQQHFSVMRRSSDQSFPENTDIMLGDTLGELLLFYAASDVAFVGGTLVADVGGHNLLEPAAVEKPILSGPVLFNFTEISQLLLQANGLIVVSDAQELATNVIKLFQDKSLRADKAKAAFTVVKQNRGTLKIILEQIDKLRRTQYT